MFVRSGTTWTQQAKLTASDAAASDDFGWAVDIDKDHIVVAAPREDTNASDAGAIYVFSRSGSTWTEVKKIQASITVGSINYLGYGGVGIHDGTIITAAPNESTKATYAGAAYIYSSQLVTNYYITQPGTYRADLQICGIDYKTNEVEVTGSVTPEKTWTNEQKITASDGSSTEYFGRRCAISGDKMVVTASSDNSHQGAAYIFTKSGTTWSQQQKLTVSGLSSSTEPQFGHCADISGNYVIVVAYEEDTDGTNAGGAYIFNFSGGTWTQQARIV